MGSERNEAFLNITSEVGKLAAVLLHKPGKELERLLPEHLKELLFDDIPWLRKMKEEHDEFAEALRQRGTAVYYVEDLLSQVLEEAEVKRAFVNELLANGQIENPELHKILFSSIYAKEPREVVQIAVAGLSKKELPELARPFSLAEYLHEENFVYISPVPNLYFMRDPAVVIGNGLSLSSMRNQTRRREPMLIKYIYEHNPLFKKTDSPLWYDYLNPHSIEGGDILVLSAEVIAIGWSERTSSNAIETIAKHLFAGRKELKAILVVHIPELRMFMHLDTVLTMADRDKFIIYPGIKHNVNVYKLSRGAKQIIKISREDNLIKALKKCLKLPAVNLIHSGGEDAVTAAREQWNDSTNTLAIAPGVVVTYGRNEVSNEVLRKNGIEVIEIGGSELVRGRGGPRCMSMPLVREEL